MNLTEDKFCPACAWLMRTEGSGYKCDNCGGQFPTTLAFKCSELLREIETLHASTECTNLAIKAGDLLTAIQHGDVPRGEYNEEERRLLNMTPRKHASQDENWTIEARLKDQLQRNRLQAIYSCAGGNDWANAVDGSAERIIWNNIHEFFEHRPTPPAKEGKA